MRSVALKLRAKMRVVMCASAVWLEILCVEAPFLQITHLSLDDAGDFNSADVFAPSRHSSLRDNNHA